MKWVKTAIGAVIAVSVIPTIVTSINALTGSGGELEDTVAGTLLDLAPLVFVAGVLAYLFLKTGSGKAD
jgi:uncharacterized PurR-regulated membrane protein YhhQ (DUF165 family)